MDTRLAVYVPSEDAADVTQLEVGRIERGSGIVGERIDDSRRAPRILIYYEGNIYGAVNMVTFADRCAHAAGRMTERYPTTAMCEVLAEALTHAGWFYPRHGVEVTDAKQLMALAKWLGYYKTGDTTFDSDALTRELRCTGAYAR